MMNNQWGSGDPTQYLTNNYFAAYDDHRYLKWSGTAVSQSNYLQVSCNDNRGGNWPTIVGEWSLSVPDNVQWTSGWNPNTQQAFYKKWFAAQAMAYERQMGWIFWTWKSQLGDYRWSYQGRVLSFKTEIMEANFWNQTALQPGLSLRIQVLCTIWGLASSSCTSGLLFECLYITVPQSCPMYLIYF
jgi:hypothetical protein